MTQTPQQRRANEKFARSEASKRGKPETVQKRKQQSQAGKSPISPVWIGLFAFVIGGGLILELLRLFF